MVCKPLFIGNWIRQEEWVDQYGDNRFSCVPFWVICNDLRFWWAGLSGEIHSFVMWFKVFRLYWTMGWVMAISIRLYPWNVKRTSLFSTFSDEKEMRWYFRISHFRIILGKCLFFSKSYRIYKKLKLEMSNLRVGNSMDLIFIQISFYWTSFAVINFPRI